jgi:arylformamidase
LNWIDCTQVVDTLMPQPAGVPEFSLRSVRSFADNGMSMQQLCLLSHHGTHVDAPRHFFPDGKAIADVPLSALCGDGVVIGFDGASLTPITADDLRRHAFLVKPGDRVLIRTGWSEHYGQPSYRDSPYLTREAAEYLLGLGISLLGIDTLSPDAPPHQGRAEPFDYPVHHMLLGAGIPIIENLRLDRTSDYRCAVMALPIPVRDGDGAPARVLVRPHGA